MRLIHLLHKVLGVEYYSKAIGLLYAAQLFTSIEGCQFENRRFLAGA